MSIAVVQSATVAAFTNGGADNTATITLTGVVAGNTLIVGCFCRDASGTAHTCTVNDGAAYTADMRVDFLNASNTWQSEIHRLTSAGAGTHTIVVTNNAGAFNAYGWCCAAEISGLAASPVDQTTNNQNAGSANPTTGSITTTQASEIVIAVATMNSLGNPAAFGHPPVSGYSSIGVATNGSAAATVGSMDYKILSSTGAENPSYSSFSNANAWSAGIVSYKAAAGGAVATRTLMLLGCG